MAYLPDHKADVFVSYAHLDNFAWIDGFKRELEKALIWKLRAATKLEIFFDTESLRAGRVFDKEIAECLEATAFSLAIVSRRYNTSTYSRHQGVGHFLKHKPAESGRTIQVQLDLSAELPVEKALAVTFASATEPFSLSSEEFRREFGESLRAHRRCTRQALCKLEADSGGADANISPGRTEEPTFGN